MRRLRFILWPVLVLAAWLMSSCGSVSPQQNVDTRPRFHEGATADMVLRFNKWDAIIMARPNTRDADGFLPLFTRDDIGREVKRRNVPRNTAVVVFSLFYRDRPQLVQLSQEWTAYLGEQGFRRVVILHAGAGDDIDGLPVLNDSAIGGVNVAGDNIEPPKITAANALIPAAVGADVANPSSAAIR